MADPLTPNVGLAVPIRGSDVGTWDIPVNGDFTLIDSMYGSVTTVALSSFSVTLATSQAQVAIIRLTGTITSNNLNIQLPALNKGWTIDNQITNSPSSFGVGLFVAAGTAIGVPPGVNDVMYDGTIMKYRNLGKLGELWEYVGATAPTWTTSTLNSSALPYLNCDGTTFSSAVYPQLFNLLGGNTLPDIRGTTRYTLNQGTARLTTANGGLDGNTNLSIKTTQVTIGTSNLPSYTPAGSIGTVTVTPPGAIGGIPYTTSGLASAIVDNPGTPTSGGNHAPATSGGSGIVWSGTANLTGSGPTFTGTAQGGVSNVLPVGAATVAGITMIKAI